jgi:hypothetical protein
MTQLPHLSATLCGAPTPLRIGGLQKTGAPDFLFGCTSSLGAAADSRPHNQWLSGQIKWLITMTKQELISALMPFDDDAVVICKDDSGGWDNIEVVEQDGSAVAICFGGGSPFSDER